LEAVAPWDALVLYVDRASAEELHDLAANGYDNAPVFMVPGGDGSADTNDYTNKVLRYRKLLDELSMSLLRMLRAGDLVAEGFSSAAAVDLPRLKIPPDRWSELKLDLRNATAEGDGMCRNHPGSRSRTSRSRS
jgi:hypothetical protein